MASSSQEVASDPPRKLDSKQLPSVHFLGKGLSGFLYETTWLGNRHTRKDFPLGSEKRNDVFENEARSLFDLDHLNIVKCFGYTIGKSSCSILLDFVDDAHDLQNTMEKRIEVQRKEQVSSSSTSRSRILDVDEIKRLSISNKVEEREITDVSSKMYESTSTFELPEAVDIILQIATGMEYLHDNEVVHGDLKPNNVLLYSTPGQMIVKLTDFGLIETKKRIKLVSKRTRHFEVLMWKAPERFEELLGPLTKNSDDPFTESDTDSDEEMGSYENFKKSRLAMADVYSFGLTCSHLLGGEPMYSNLSLTQLREQRMRGFRPELPSACPEYLKFIIYSSLEPQPSSRPTFSRICTLLLKALQSKQLPRLMQVAGTSTTASNYTVRSMSTSTVDSEPMGMDDLPAEMLIKHVFPKLPLFDLLRARAVCKRWQNIVPLDTIHFRDESNTAQSYCPLIFKRNSQHHLWCGYDSTSGTWKPLPTLSNLPQVDIRPLTGNGKSLLGFRITSVPSEVVVGNPFTSDWQIIPKSSETRGEVGNILVVDRNDTSAFQIIAVREDATEIYHSKVEVWAKLRQRPPEGLQEITVLCIKDKLISASLCGGLLFCYGRNTLVSFDVVRERWTEDRIPIPHHASSKCFQMLECVGNLFAAIEDVAQCTITVWGLGQKCRKFYPVVEMPQQLYSVLCRKMGKHIVQLKAVGHKHRMYFWRNFSNKGPSIIVFDLLRRTWDMLPEFDQCIRHAPTDQSEEPEDFQIFVDTGSFEP